MVQILFPDPSSCPTFLVNMISLLTHKLRWFLFSKLVGHSMGGSVVVRSCPVLIEKRYRIAGVAVLDVVEGSHTHPKQFLLNLIHLSLGSAIEALPHMNSLLNARPDGFDSIEEAIEWQWVVIRLSDRFTYYLFFSVSTNTIHNATSARISIPSIFQSTEGSLLPYKWRTPLRSTAPYWLSQ